MTAQRPPSLTAAQGLEYYTNQVALDNFLDVHYTELVTELQEVVRTQVGEHEQFEVKTLLGQIPLIVQQGFSITSQVKLVRIVLRNMVERGECQRVSRQLFKL